MPAECFTFSFVASSDLPEAAITLWLARIAAEGLYGEARVRTEVAHTINTYSVEITVTGRTPVAASVAQIYTALLTREFGRDAFRVRRQLAGAEAAVCG